MTPRKLSNARRNRAAAEYSKDDKKLASAAPVHAFVRTLNDCRRIPNLLVVRFLQTYYVAWERGDIRGLFLSGILNRLAKDPTCCAIDHDYAIMNVCASFSLKRYTGLCLIFFDDSTCR